MKRIYFLILNFLIALLLIGGMAESAFAQACSVSSTATAAGTRSTSCFVKAGNQLIVTLSGTWVATNQLQMSQDGGTTWTIVESDTANINTITPKQTNDVRFAWLPYAFTSGTIAYTMNDLSITLGRIKYENIPIGPTAYASIGTSTAGSSTVTMSTDIFVEAEFTTTGAAVLVGATGGTDKFVFVLRDSTGKLITTTALAGTTVSASANAFQEIAWVNPVTIPRGRYYLDIQTNGTTATTRRIATVTYLDVTAAETSSTVFGTVPTYLVEPTTFTALKAPAAYLY